MKPQQQRVINELDGAAQAIVIDIESDQEIAEQAGVSGTPTIQLFHHKEMVKQWRGVKQRSCLLYTSPSPRDGLLSRMPSSA